MISSQLDYSVRVWACLTTVLFHFNLDIQTRVSKATCVLQLSHSSLVCQASFLFCLLLSALMKLFRFDFFLSLLLNLYFSLKCWTCLLIKSCLFEQSPVSHIPDAVYRTSVDWINQRSGTALSSFVILLLDTILTDLNNQLPSIKNAKKASLQPSSKSQVITVALF